MEEYNNNFENNDNITDDQGFYTKPHEEIIQDDLSKTYYTPPSGGYYKPPVKKKKEKKRYPVGAVILSGILAAVIGAAGAVAGMYFLKPDTVYNQTSEGENDITQNNVSINVEKTAENVVEAVSQKVSPSVIGIRTTTSVMSFFGGTSQSSGEGSGVVYTKDGYIITNYHVISNAIDNKSGSKIEVFIDSASSKSYEASVVGYNISADLAVIKINANGLTPAEIGDSSKLKVGQHVITIGNPGGLEFMKSVTYGVVSGLDRVVSTDSDIKLIQTDAAINPGNSGGALLNTQGQLVGINSAKIVSEEFEGMGFAIPSNTVVEICDNIISKENSPEPYVGITVSEKYTSEILDFYGFPNGAVVLSVDNGSPADSAGIEKGDIITEFNGREIKEYTLFAEILSECTPEQKVAVKIYRNGRYYSTNITIGSNNQVG